MAKPLSVAEQKRVKDWLKAHGHSTSKVDGLDFSDENKKKRSILTLHGITPEQYRQVGGTVD